VRTSQEWRAALAACDTSASGESPEKLWWPPAHAWSSAYPPAAQMRVA
jgi:hypothetical protein